MNRYHRIAILGLFAILAELAPSQSFNVDLNINDEEALGGGVPSDFFGAAANQPGRWNNLYVLEDLPWLYDLQGVPRNVSIVAATAGSTSAGGGFRNETNTGNFARLLNDFTAVDSFWRTWTFHGLANGAYIVTTYSVRPFSTFVEARISINGGPIAIATGPMPGNQLIEGITHVTQGASVTNGVLEIHVSRYIFGEIAAVNGFQITAVPEPTTISICICALACLLARKRNSS